MPLSQLPFSVSSVEERIEMEKEDDPPQHRDEATPSCTSKSTSTISSLCLEGEESSDEQGDSSNTTNEEKDEEEYDANVHRAQFFAESAELFLVFNSKYQLVDANLTALTWFGKTRETMNEIVMVDLCHPDHLEGTYKAMAESAPHTNLVLHGPSGIYRWLSWRPIKSRSSGFFYAAGRDVTTEIEGKSNAESFVRLLCHEIRNPLLGIMGVTDVLLEQRPPLQAMLSFFEECLAVQNQQQQQDATKRDNEVDATTRNATNAALIQQAKHHIEQRIESVDLMRNCCAQLNSVVNTTLNVSKLTSGKSELVMVPFQPRAVLESSSDVMMGLALGRNVGLQVCSYNRSVGHTKEEQDIANTSDRHSHSPSLPPPPPPPPHDDDDSVLDPSLFHYMGDQAWLTQVLVNVLSNSIKFTREGGQVVAQVHVTSRQPSQQDTKECTQQQQQQRAQNGSVVVGAAPDLKKTEHQALDKLVVFTVTDTGVGMTESESKELFQPFMNTSSSCSNFSSSSSSSASRVSGNVPPGPNVTNYANCGLGLHISHSVITRMGGTIEVTSKVGKGTSVCIKIPTRVCTDDELSPKKDKVDRNEKADVAAAVNVAAAFQGGRANMGSRPCRATRCGDGTNGKYHHDDDDDDDTTAAVMAEEEIFPSMNIMVVDDVRLNRSIASRIISATGDHNMYEAIDGLECLQIVTSIFHSSEQQQSEQKQTLDLVLMDVSMPGIDGLETTRRLRSGMPPNCRQPYIAGVSAFSSPEDRAAALASGMDTYVVKPYSKHDVLVVLREALLRKQQSSQPS